MEDIESAIVEVSWCFDRGQMVMEMAMLCLQRKRDVRKSKQDEDEERSGYPIEETNNALSRQSRIFK